LRSESNCGEYIVQRFCAELTTDVSKVRQLDDRDWDEARRRLALIQPVLDAARLPRSEMSERGARRRS
jgi:hypothetical protein